MSDEDGAESRAVVLDYLPRGGADRPDYDHVPVAQSLDLDTFALYEFELTPDADVSIGDVVTVRPASERPPGVESVRTVEYGDLSGGAQSELEYAVEELVEAEADRFVEFFNDAQPITLRLHQLDLLPGIGEKLRNGIIDERKRGPFDSFPDLADRVNGLHDPESVVVERVLEEIREDDLKYRAFATGQERQER